MVMNASTGKLRVLVIDDDHDAANSLASVLRLHDCEADVAHNGRKALAMATEFAPDVMLLDINMPLVDGFDVAKQIHEYPWVKRPFMIAITGQNSDEYRQRANLVGIDVFLCKPVDLTKLWALIHRFSQFVDIPAPPAMMSAMTVA